MKSSTLKTILLIAILFVVTFGLVAWFNSMKEPPTEIKEKKLVLHVHAADIDYKDMDSYVEATGRLVSGRLVSLIPEVQGIILQGDVTLKKGQSFSKGDALCKIFSEEAALSLQGQKSRFLNSLANILPDFRVDYPDSYKTWEQFFNSIDIEKDIPDMPKPGTDKEKIYLASRNILSDYYAIKSAEIRLKKYTLYAPFDGSITQVSLEIGSVANPGQPIATIIRTDNLELEVPIEFSESKWVKMGDNVEILNEDRTKSWSGRVVRKSGFIDQSTQSLSLFVKVEPRATQELYQGQYLRARFAGIRIDSCMELPRSAVFNNNEVFLIEDGKLVKAEIDILKRNQRTLLFRGPAEGSVIVTEALANATEDMNAERIGTHTEANEQTIGEEETADADENNSSEDE